MENLKQQLLEHIADLLDNQEFKLDMILQDCIDPEPVNKTDLHLLMTDAAFKVFCEYFNKQDDTEQCIINDVGNTLPTSTQLIQDCKKRFEELKENYSFDWRSFYNGYLESFGKYAVKYKK